MRNPEKITDGWKEKARRELIEYGVNVIYLTLVFAAFTVYRRLLLSAHDISYTNYGVAVIEALILGKVIMIGGVLRLGRGLEDQPLIYPTLYKSAVFGVFVGVFKLVEHAIGGLLSGEGLTRGLFALSENGLDLLLANSLVIFVALIPFFALKERERVLGEQTIRGLFFRKRTDV